MKIISTQMSFKIHFRCGNPTLCSGVIAVPSGPKSHTFTVILAVFAPQPRWRHKPWKGLFMLSLWQSVTYQIYVDQKLVFSDVSINPVTLVITIKLILPLSVKFPRCRSTHEMFLKTEKRFVLMFRTWGTCPKSSTQSGSDNTYAHA